MSLTLPRYAMHPVGYSTATRRHRQKGAAVVKSEFRVLSHTDTTVSQNTIDRIEYTELAAHANAARRVSLDPERLHTVWRVDFYNRGLAAVHTRIG